MVGQGPGLPGLIDQGEVEAHLARITIQAGRISEPSSVDGSQAGALTGMTGQRPRCWVQGAG